METNVLNEDMAVMQRLIEKSTKDIYSSKLELKRSHRFLEEVHRAMPGVLIVFNEAEEIVSVSASTCRLLAYEEHELLGVKLETILDRDDELDPRLWNKTGESAFEAEVSFLSKAGESVPIWLSASVGPRVGSQPAWFMVIGQDLRERKKSRRFSYGTPRSSRPSVSWQPESPMNSIRRFSS